MHGERPPILLKGARATRSAGSNGAGSTSDPRRRSPLRAASYSAVDAGHPGLVVTLAGCLRELCVDAGKVICAELDVDRGGVLLEVGAALRARDRHDVVTLREQPRDRELRRRDAFFGGDLLDLVGEAQIGPQVVAGKSRAGTAEVALV